MEAELRETVKKLMRTCDTMRNKLLYERLMTATQDPNMWMTCDHPKCEKMATGACTHNGCSKSICNEHDYGQVIMFGEDMFTISLCERHKQK